MEQQIINNGDTGLDVRTKINSNFTELYEEAPVPGPPGPQGPQGIQGEPGIQGPQGIQGLTGPQGPQGAQGIQGVKGDTGDIGPQGPQGLQGLQGIDGQDGPQGIQGPAGIQGPIGPEGPAGADGTSIVLKGAVPTVQDLPSTGNVEGDLYVVTATGDGYVWDGLAWQNVGPIRGPQGIQGETGPQGIQGIPGTNGIDGEDGLQGIQGIQGIQGEIGPQGIQGIQGPIGPEGPQGIPGVSGGGNTYATVALMVAAGTLVAGDMAETLGYYAANDGGGARYQITSSADTVDGGSVISVGGGLQAKLVVANNTFAIAQFGAKNDAVTDNLNPIQNAINYASTFKGTIVFKAGTYLVSSSIQMKSFVTLFGYGAKIHRNSNATEVTIFHSTTSYYLYDVALIGMTLQSTEDRAGSGDYTGATVSNVMAMYFEGISGFTLKDVKCLGVNIAVKLGKGGTGTEYNHNIRIDNLFVDGANPMLLFWTYDAKISNSRFDATSTGGTLLHAFYFKQGCSDFTFDNCEFIGAPGAGIHAYNSVPADPQVHNIQLVNCKFTNCVTALYIWSKATHWLLDNIIIKGCTNAIYINDSYYITVSNVHVDDIGASSVYVFRITSTSDVTFNNIIVDATGLVGPYIYPTGTNVNFRLINCKLLNFVGSSYYLINGAVAFTNFEIRGCIFHLTALDRSRLRIESASSTGVIVDNRFYVDSTSFTEIIDIYAGALVLVANNAYKGPTNLCKTTDSAKTTRNINMTTWATDPTRNIT